MSDAPPDGAIDCVLAYAAPGLQLCIELRLPAGATVASACAAAQARLAMTMPEQASQVPWDEAECGIFGQPCSRSQRLQAGDRVELYRPLAVDPRESRRHRVQAARNGKGGAARRS
jgi:putative ubiquitin-RnfH superfamily antitoxin RatB of RatAB toxin-antitoxin module